LLQSCVITSVASNSSPLECDCLAHRFGNAADRPNRVRRYPSDMTDEEWRVVRTVPPTLAWLEGRGGQPEDYCHRQMLDAVFCPMPSNSRVCASIAVRTQPRSPRWGS
jgi:hypothetical protein